MRPFFFGSSEKPLFGIYHPPAPGSERRGNAVICYPFGREYIRAHRAMRELAQGLAQSGFHTLRFDYYGSGDSAGNSEEADIDQWLGNIVLAVDEATALGGSDETTLVGLRLGAALAATVGSRMERLSKLVLWDPVVRGRDYIRELVQTQQIWMQAHPILHGEEAGANGHVLGFPLTKSLRDAVARIDLLQIPACPARNTLIVSSTGSADARQLCRAFERLTPTDYREIPAAEVWLRQENVNQAVVPLQTIRAISSWLAETPP
jgi:pimeloyl-ACP methyl ester carboxylesterase